jgi:phage portal protein BeeE
MGFISELAQSKAFPGQEAGRQTWERVFGTDKERPRPASAQPNNGGSWGRSFTNAASFKRMLEAYRSKAPGGWTDDRYEQTKHQVGIQHICITRTGEQLMMGEYQVSMRDPQHPDGKRPVPSDHPLVRLLGRPNNEDSFGDLLYAYWQQMNLTGTALTWMVPNVEGRPVELYPIPTAIAIPQPTINPEYPNGFYRIQPYYPYGPFSSYPTPSGSVGAAIPAEWMMRIKFQHPLLRYDGYSPQTALRLHLDEVESIDRSRWYSMKRSINPSGVLNFDEMEGMQPLPQEEIDRIHAEWENEFQGPENTGRLIVGTPGGRLDPWGASPVDMDYQMGWAQLVDFAMAGFGITKGAAGMTEGVSSYAALFAMLKQLHLMTLQPFCNRVGAKLTRFLAPFFGDDLIIEVRCPRIDDHDLKLAKLQALQGAKAITKGQFLRELEMPPFGDERDEELAGEGGEQAEMQKAQMAQQQQAQEQQAGMQQQQMGMEQEQAEAGQRPTPPDLSQFDEEGNPVGAEQEEPDEIIDTRPGPEELGEGALGPRKSLLAALNKSHTNGNGKHKPQKPKTLYQRISERCRQ